MLNPLALQFMRGSRTAAHGRLASGRLANCQFREIRGRLVYRSQQQIRMAERSITEYHHPNA